MGWYTGKKPIYKLNQLKLGRTQQEDFLRSYLKLNKREIKELKQKLGGAALSGNKLLTASQFKKVMADHEPNISEKWQEYVQQKEKEYGEYQERIKKENIKKVRERERKQEAADKMIHQLVGREKPGSWREKIKKSIMAERVDKSNDDLTPAAWRVIRAKEKLAERKRTDWQHADLGKSANITEALDKKKKSETLTSSESEVDIDKVKEEAKKLPELPI